MVFNKNELIELILANGKARNFLNGCNIEGLELVTAQTMHDVFRIPNKTKSDNLENKSFVGAYLKIAKAGKNGPDKKEMEIEAFWYNTFRDSFKLPNSPKAITFELGEGNFAIAVDGVSGKTYDKIFRELAKKGQLEESRELKQVMDLSTKIAVLGAELHKKDPSASPVYFGEFNEGEHAFLNRRTEKILRENGYILGNELEKVLSSTREALTNPETWLFYRDATPLNWIEYSDTHFNHPVAIDLGTTSYRPPQFEAIALFETPNTGFETLSEKQRMKLLLGYKARLEEQGAKLGSDQEFITMYGLASVVKNISGVASRIDHINKNRADIDSENAERVALGTARLQGNREGRDFHKARALYALEISEEFFNPIRLDYLMVKGALEVL